jgi:pimeloyl-ACP methyl ester carboxylesterase
LGRRVQVRPYAALLKALRDAGADVLVVPYDWRLSNRFNAFVLERRILERWYQGDPPPRQRRLPEAERITFIGHSMGGLVARCFLEGRPLGPVLGRRLITVGTPHRGAPVAYLHLVGRTHPFPESPFAAAAGEVTAQLLPGGVQTALVQFMSSAFELLPNYNFVTNQGRTEEYPDTYAGQVHHPTGTPAISLVRRLRSSIVHERELDGWLRARDLEYHFLGASGFTTVVGYDRGRDRPLTGRKGDGTVPLDSARLLPVSTANLRARTLTGERDLGHQKLCQRRDVQAYCLNVLRGQRPAAGAGTTAVQDPQVEDFVAMAKVILKAAPASRGIVLSVVRLAGEGGPLIDTTVEASRTSPRRRLKNPPRHLSSPEIFEVWSPRLQRTFRYVWILSNEQATHPVGGMLFLPASWERHVHLVTFNVGNLDARSRRQCRNAHHAELQLVRWVEEQPATWRARLRAVVVANRSRSARVRGYSPCNACCADLIHFLVNLRALTGRPVDAAISWLEPYTKGGICGHPTDRANLDRLRAAGWQLDGPLPASAPSRPGPMLAPPLGAGAGPPSRGGSR